MCKFSCGICFCQMQQKMNTLHGACVGFEQFAVYTLEGVVGSLWCKVDFLMRLCNCHCCSWEWLGIPVAIRCCGREGRPQRRTVASHTAFSSGTHVHTPTLRPRASGGWMVREQFIQGERLRLRLTMFTFLRACPSVASSHPLDRSRLRLTLCSLSCEPVHLWFHRIHSTGQQSATREYVALAISFLLASSSSIGRLHGENSGTRTSGRNSFSTISTT